MKLATLFLVVACGVGSARAQQIRPVMRPPESVTPKGLAARSTAQAGAAHQLPLTALPDFVAVGLDGKPVAARTLARSSHWLLFYTRENCEPCEKVMAALGGSENPNLKRGAPYVIVLARSRTYGALDAARAKHATLADATWLEDRSGAAVAALKPTGAPMLYGMHGSQVAWTIPGGLDNPATVEKIAGSWLASEDFHAPVVAGPIATAAAPNARVAANQR